MNFKMIHKKYFKHTIINYKIAEKFGFSFSICHVPEILVWDYIAENLGRQYGLKWQRHYLEVLENCGLNLGTEEIPSICFGRSDQNL
jgi:hypothetical protein